MDQSFIDIEIKNLIKWQGENGEGCLASDKITKDGYKVGYMYREEPDEGKPDSGWRFFAGDEDDNYINEPNNFHIFAINTICNYDPDIIPYVFSDVGSVYIRINEKEFESDRKDIQAYITKQKK